MKSGKKSIIYALLAGLIISTVNCRPDHAPKVRLVEWRVLDHFPSASAIEYHNHRLYVFGDDASYLLVLDTLYQKQDSISFFSDTAYRIAKDIKPDIESAAIITNGNKSFLYALGSFSAASRRNLYYFPLSSPDSFVVMDHSKLIFQLPGKGVINIEGLAFVGSDYILANRANSNSVANYIFIAGNDKDSAAHAIRINLDTATVKGLSGLYYDSENDRMFFTASEEETSNAIDDGRISDSYLGWIDRFSRRMPGNEIEPDALVRLSDMDPAFAKQKIESVCVQHQAGKTYTLHLVADNDDGRSTIFRIRLLL